MIIKNYRFTLHFSKFKISKRDMLYMNRGFIVIGISYASFSTKVSQLQYIYNIMLLKPSKTVVYIQFLSLTFILRYQNHFIFIKYNINILFITRWHVTKSINGIINQIIQRIKGLRSLHIFFLKKSITVENGTCRK